MNQSSQGSIDSSKHEELLPNLISKAGNLYCSPNRSSFKNSLVGITIRDKLPLIIRKKVEDKYNLENYKIMGSIGQGQYAEIAWISIFDKDITESATKGIYIVFLYSADGESVYLSLNQGFTYFKEKFSLKNALKEIKKISAILRDVIGPFDNRFIDSINLSATKPLGKGYEAGHIVGIKYELSNMPSENEIVRDIIELLAIYKYIKKMFAGRNVHEFYDYLIAKDQGLITLKTVEENVNSSNVIRIKTADFIDKPKEKDEPIIDDKGIRRFPRDRTVASNALIQGHFLCSYDEEHVTFTAKGTNHMYVEAHHLIPLCESDEFSCSLDVEANIVSLCSVCHDCVHHGSDEEKKKIISSLYEQRKERLEKAGIHISLGQLLRFYQISI